MIRETRTKRKGVEDDLRSTFAEAKEEDVTIFTYAIIFWRCCEGVETKKKGRRRRRRGAETFS